MTETIVGPTRYCSFMTNYRNCMQESKDFGRNEEEASKHIKGWIDFMLRNNYDFSMKSQITVVENDKRTYIKTMRWTEWDGNKYWAKWTFKNFK